MKTTGNTILITGGGTGIGEGLAHRFHDLGNTVIVAGRTLASLEKAVAGRANMHPLVMDAADDASVTAAVEVLARDFPALNLLIHSAGIMSRDELNPGRLDLALAQRIVETNLIGTFRVVEALLPQLLSNPDPVVCTVSSGLGFVPLPSAPAYSATKAAVHSYSLSLRQRLKGKAEVIEIAPPGVRTDLNPGQRDIEAYMPLDAYIAETMDNFLKVPTPQENLVGNVLPLRNAEKEGRMEAMLDLLGGH